MRERGKPGPLLIAIQAQGTNLKRAARYACPNNADKDPIKQYTIPRFKPLTPTQAGSLGKAGRFTYLLEVFAAVSKPSRFTPFQKR